MLSNRINRIGIFIFACVWVCFAAEVFLMIFDPQPMLPRYIMEGDFGIRVNMPNQTYFHQTPDYKVEIRTNSKGMRANREFDYEKPEGVIRIVVLSDSFGMGYGVNFEDSFTERMRNGLEREQGNKVEVINLSVSGYGTAEQLLMLKNEGIKYHPDIVLLTWHATDVNDNIRSGLYQLEEGVLVRNHATYLPGVKIREFLFSFTTYRWLAGNSHFYNWIRDFAGSRIKVLMAAIQRTRVSELKQTDLNDYALSLALLETVKTESEKVGAKLLLLQIPIRVSRSEFHSSIPELIKKQLSVIDPIDGFVQHQGELIYWEKSHGHFTPLGCEIVANSLVVEIEKLLNNKN